MIIGLLESQRGKDAAAVAAFRQAEANLSTNAMAPYYLGQSLVLVGQPETAAEAFERAITRKPIRNDLLDIFQALGRVYQRAQRTDKALDVWNRLEKLFPDDARVQEQIATTLVEEGQFEQALPRLQKLASTTDDKYRQSMLRMDVAELKVKLKKSAEAPSLASPSITRSGSKRTRPMWTPSPGWRKTCRRRAARRKPKPGWKRG